MAKKKKDPIDSYGSKEELYDKAKAAYYCSPPRDFILFNADTFELLPQSNFKFDMIFADPPYFLSSGGISVQSRAEWFLPYPCHRLNACLVP
jgi:tRNA1(Val) A37 N6-methylase TrmN6